MRVFTGMVASTAGAALLVACTTTVPHDGVAPSASAPVGPEEDLAAAGRANGTAAFDIALAVGARHDADTETDAFAGDGQTATGDEREGTWVVAARAGTAQPADLMLVAADGGGVRPLTQTAWRHELQPRWSPDRTKIAFLALPADAAPGANASLFVIDADGMNERELATDVSGTSAWADHGSRWPPTWSPAGDQIAYVHHLPSCAPPPDPSWYEADPCVSDIRVVDVASGTPISGPSLPSMRWKWATEPVWLATGPLLYVWTCFGESCPGSGPWLFQEQPSLRNTQVGGRQFAFTRSSARFLVAAYREEELVSSYPYRDVPGSLQVCETEYGFKVHHTGGDCTVIGGDAHGWSPRWSPRESAVAFLRDDGVWVQALGAPRAERAFATMRPAGLDW